MERLIAVFNDLLESKTVGDVDGLLNKHGIEKKYHFPEAIYPKLDVRISYEEILTLKKRGILGEDNNVKDISGFNAAEKLLYALIWKNGDLKKVKHIVNGILADLNDSIGE